MDVYLAKGVDIAVYDFEMVITLKHDVSISYRPRRLAFVEKEKLQVILDNLLEKKMIRPSTSLYASPIVLNKKNGNLQLCMDYRELNKIIIKDNFPTPLINDHLDRLRDRKIFSSLDLKNGFHHVRMMEESIKYTSFITPLEQYEYLRMPFRLANAPCVFQQFMYTVFELLIRTRKILLYIDDILIATETMEKHLQTLRKVFHLARQHRLEF